MLFALLMTLSVSAQDCDAGELVAQLEDASPHEAAPMFVRLAGCDEAAAAKAATTTIPTLLGTNEGLEAATVAIRIGAGEVVQSWMSDLQRDERARAVRALGKRCTDEPTIQAFFQAAESSLGGTFWTDRWYRALTSCRAPAIVTLLSNKVDAGIGEDRGLYFAVVEAYASNAGMDAVNKLTSLIAAQDDVEVQINLIGAFADAAQVGTLPGMDPKIAVAAADALKGMASDLPVKAIDQARITLLALGDEMGADALVSVRYNGLLQDGDQLLYGTVVVENAMCKNGSPAQRVHIAEVVDPGQTWPDQLEDKIAASIQVTWKLNLAERCKGDGDVKILVPDAPFADKAAYKAWVQSQLKLQLKASVKKSVRVDEAPIEI